MGLVALLLVYLLNVLTKSDAVLPLWLPAGGLGLCLVAWFGLRFAAAVLFGAGLVLLVHHGVSAGVQGALAASSLAWLGGTAVLDVGESVLAWYLYHDLGRGSRRLLDPRSATQFVFLVPGVAGVVSAVARAGLAWPFGPPPWTAWPAESAVSPG